MALRATINPLLVLVALAAIAIPWYTVARTLADAKPVARSSVSPSGVVWGDRVFTSRDDLTAWLHRRGAAYSVWASRHPHAHGGLGR